MNASSQTPGALPPELEPVRPASLEEARATYAAYDVALPMPVTPEPPAVTTLQAATAVLDARMAQGGGATGEQLAEAERTAGILFDPASVQAAVDAARDQARTEYEAELTEARKQLAVMAGARRQVDAVLRLCEGRLGDDLLLVSAVAVAAESGTTALDDFPMRLTWNRSARVPDAHDAHKRVVVECTSSYGGRADLVVDGDDRMAFASLLNAEARDINATCPTPDCGTGQDWDPSNPFLTGWSRLEVAALGDGPRWYCSDMCVFDALARAGHDIAADDQAAAIDPHQQAPVLLTPETATGWEAGWEPEDVATDLDARYGAGASDEYALQVAEAADEALEGERGNDGDGEW